MQMLHVLVEGGQKFVKHWLALGHLFVIWLAVRLFKNLTVNLSWCYDLFLFLWSLIEKYVSHNMIMYYNGLGVTRTAIT